MVELSMEWAPILGMMSWNVIPSGLELGPESYMERTKQLMRRAKWYETRFKSQLQIKITAARSNLEGMDDLYQFLNDEEREYVDSMAFADRVRDQRIQYIPYDRSQLDYAIKGTQTEDLFVLYFSEIT